MQIDSRLGLSLAGQPPYFVASGLGLSIWFPLPFVPDRHNGSLLWLADRTSMPNIAPVLGQTIPTPEPVANNF